MIENRKGYFFDATSSINQYLTTAEILRNSEVIQMHFPNTSIDESYWDVCVSLVLLSEFPIVLEAKLSLHSRAREIFFSLPEALPSDYISVNDTILPLRKSDIQGLQKLIDGNATINFSKLSVPDVVHLENLALEYGWVFRGRDLKNKYFSDSHFDTSVFENLLDVQPYPYQAIGIEWLCAQKKQGRPGVILGDVMGLGKTLQAIGFLTQEINASHPNNLVVCPGTLIPNWKKEINKFSSQLDPYIHFGPMRAGTVSRLKDKPLIITSYETLVNDYAILSPIQWNCVILDEAQFIKNSNSKRSLRARSLSRDFSIAITGTPLENKLNDLWTMSDFSSPNIFEDELAFEQQYTGTESGALQVNELISPFLLRRKLDDIEHQLPDMTIIDHPLEWPETLIDIYEETRLTALSDFKHAGGMVATGRLRQLTTHPQLLGILSSNLQDFSPKLTVTLQIIAELFANGEKALIFCSYIDMIDILLREISELFPDAFIANLDGRINPTEKRMQLVEHFNAAKGPGVLICNPQVAGAGLNIIGANHVIHYNLEWNPAKEDQATFRVYRNGQLKQTFVHRLYYTNTIDEVIDDRLKIKRDLADLSVDAGLSTEDWMTCIQVSPKCPTNVANELNFSQFTNDSVQK